MLERIQGRKKEIDVLENKRVKIYKFLSEKDAIKDLSESYLRISEKREHINDIQGKVKIYNDLRSNKAELDIEAKKLIRDLLKFTEDKNQISDFYDQLKEIYNFVFGQNNGEVKFYFDVRERTDSKLDIVMSVPAEMSKGKNQSKVLLYDLSILIHSIKKGFKGPKFLIHDGIFDGMDKAHFLYVYKYLENIKQIFDFQYIVTLNEEGSLGDNFGNTEKIDTNKLKKEAICVLTPSNKLFNRDF